MSAFPNCEHPACIAARAELEAETPIDSNAEPRDRDSDGAFDYDAQGMTEYDRESIAAAGRGHLLR